MCPLNVRCCTLQCWLRCSGHQLHWVSVSSGPKLAFLAFSTLRTLLKTSQASKIPNWRGKSWARGGYTTLSDWIWINFPHGGLTFTALWTDLALIRGSKRTQALSFTSSILKTLWCQNISKSLKGKGANKIFQNWKSTLQLGTLSQSLNIWN